MFLGTKKLFIFHLKLINLHNTIFHYKPINPFHMHIGTRIRKQLNERHQTVVWLARQLACSRTNVYKIFDKSNLDTALLMRISIILNYDFFKLYSEQFQKGECSEE